MRIPPLHAGAAAFCALVLSGLSLTPAHANPVKADHIEVELVSEMDAATPGKTLQVGLRFKLEDHWHIYWKNPGDSGQAPRIRWDLPKGFVAQEPQWPYPSLVPTGPIMNFGYEGEVLLPVSIEVPEDIVGIAEGDLMTLTAKVGWLVCYENCIPGRATLSLSIPVHSGTAKPNGKVTELFAQARRALGKPLPSPVQLTRKGDFIELNATLPGTLDTPIDLRVFPLQQLAVVHGAPQKVESEPRGENTHVAVQLQRDKTRTEPLTALTGTMVYASGGQKVSVHFEGTLADAPQDAKTAVLGALKANPDGAAAETPITFWLALALAFGGGLLLNLMPCVFPVLSLKVLGFVETAHDKSASRRHGWAYTAGVLVSFWLLAGLLLGLRAGSESLGWGFQLQSPGFIAALSLLIFLFGLNLLGTFEIGIALTRLGGVGAGGRGLGGSFVTGVLATVVATPCTAPFMGSALGYALTQPALESIAVFTSLGLGMASPYVGLSYFPAVLKRLPRPGKWMETLRQAMAFPLFATVIWLLAVFAQLTDGLAVYELLGALLIVSMGAWIYGRYQTSAGRPAFAWILAAVVVLGGSGIGVQASKREPQEATQKADGFWQPWSPAKVAALRNEGRSVFVNFTAAWCINCKANELMVFSNEGIQQAFADRGVVALKADWTNKNDQIAQELKKHGRAGVPLYLFYPANRQGAPEILPSILTRDIVMGALNAHMTMRQP